VPCYTTILACLGLPVFSFKNSVINGAIFGETNCEHKMYVLITSTNLSETILLVRKLQRDIIINVYRVPWRVPHFFFRFSWNLDFLGRFSKTTQISSFMKIHPMGAELFYAYGQTDRQTDMKRNSCFSQVCGKHQVTRLRTRCCDAPHMLLSKFRIIWTNCMTLVVNLMPLQDTAAT
jgi:hypothetical protein